MNWNPSTKNSSGLKVSLPAQISVCGHTTDLQTYELIQSAADKLFLVLSSLYTPVTTGEANAECQNKDKGTRKAD